jgi:hypothetical protein
MMVYAITTQVGHTVSNTISKVERADTPVSADQGAIFLFVAIGLLLTAAFFTLGFGVEIGQIMAVSG